MPWAPPCRSLKPAWPGFFCRRATAFAVKNARPWTTLLSWLTAAVHASVAAAWPVLPSNRGKKRPRRRCKSQPRAWTRWSCTPSCVWRRRWQRRFLYGRFDTSYAHGYVDLTISSAVTVASCARSLSLGLPRRKRRRWVLVPRPGRRHSGVWRRDRL